MADPAPLRFLTFTVPGDAVSHRPRMSRSGVYNPVRLNEYKDLVALMVRQKMATKRDPVTTYAVSAHFYLSTIRRVDGDNLLKSVVDGITRSGLWADDSQVHEWHAHLHFEASETPRTDVVVSTLGTMPGREIRVCRCGTTFVAKRIRSHPAGGVYCSKECHYDGLRARSARGQERAYLGPN